MLELVVARSLVLVCLFVVSHFLLVFGIIFDEGEILHKPEINSRLTVQSVNVWLTVSSLANKDPNSKSNMLFRQLELNWINAPLNDDNDYIALYLDSEPDVSLAPVPVSVHYLNSISGKLLLQDHYLPVINFYNESFSSEEPAVLRESFRQQVPANRRLGLEDNRWHQYQSPVSPTSDSGNWLQHQHKRRRYDVDVGDQPERRNEPRPVYSTDLWPQQPTQAEKRPVLIDECIGYCVAYHSQGKILAKSCLRTQPNWMRDARIGSRALTTIAVAGTHNSGTYLKQRPAAYKVDKSVLQLINKYQLNQEESVFNQLVYGIRYLDLRVGYSKVKHRPEELWIYHDIFRTDNSLDEILNQIKRFLELTSSEILIVDFHRFTVGFQNEDQQTELERHGKVLDLLFNTLGAHIVPSYLGQNAPLNEYLALGKRLFVGYAGRSRLLGAQSQQIHDDQYHPLQFGLNLNKLPTDQQVRDIDADKQDSNQTMASARDHTLAHNHEVDDQLEREMSDRRIGTRVYNRLKSLKLISHSFSKRSIQLHKISNKPTGNNQLKRVGNIYKGKQHEPMPTPTTDRNMPVPTSSRLLGTGHWQAQNEHSFNSKLSLLFNPVHHVWPNTDKEDTLKQFIEQSTCRKHFGELNSLMAELTPTVFGAISDKYDGIRKLSSLTNRMVSDLIRSKFLHCINLVATDYFLGNDLIRLTIYANKMRQHQDRGLDLEPANQCKSFRRIKPLLEKSRATDSILHQFPSTTTPLSSFQSDGISDLFTSFFKRLFNF